MLAATRQKDRDGRGDGIHVYRVGADAVWTQVQHVTGEENPSLFTPRPNGRVMYVVHGGLTNVSAFGIDPVSGELRLLNRQPCSGSNPVDAALDSSNRFLVVANHSSGSVAVLPLDTDGSLQPVSQLFELTGTPGPDPMQQSSSHPHVVIFDPSRRFVIVPDKGFDRTFIFRFEDGRIALNQAMPSRPGATALHLSPDTIGALREQRAGLHGDCVSLERWPHRGDRGSQHAPGGVDGEEHHSRNRRRTGWAVCLCVEPRARQHRDFRGRRQRVSEAAWLRADGRKAAAVLRTGSGWRVSLCGEPGERHRSCIRGRQGARDTAAHRGEVCVGSPSAISFGM